MHWLNLSQSYLNIVIVVCSILSFATIVNLILSITRKNNPVFAKVKIIIRSWWIITATILFAGFFGKYGFLFVFIFIIGFVLNEFFHGETITKVKRYLQSLAALYTLILVYLIHDGNYDLFTALPFLYVIFTFPFLLLIKGVVSYLPKLLASYFGILFIIHCILYLPALVFIGPQFFGDYNKAILLFFLVAGLTQANDIFQFIFGKLFGKNKVLPHISPNKTEAGFIGGTIMTSLAGMFLFSKLFDYSITFSLLLGFCVSVFGIFGDLTFSSVKRYFKIKDFSNLLPGHGGVMDRLDSLIFTGPVIFHIIKFYKDINL